MASHAGPAAAHGATTHHVHGPAEHAGDPKTYWKVFAALMVLLFVTVGAAVVDFQALTGNLIPGLNIIIAMTIAVVKATLVVLYFMHVKGSTRLTTIWAGAGFVWLLLMFCMILSDYVARQSIDLPAQGWEGHAYESAPSSGQ